MRWSLFSLLRHEKAEAQRIQEEYWTEHETYLPLKSILKHVVLALPYKLKIKPFLFLG